MICGAKRFLVDIEVDGTRKVKRVSARTPVAARKVIREEYGQNLEILTVRINS